MLRSGLSALSGVPRFCRLVACPHPNKLGLVPPLSCQPLVLPLSRHVFNSNLDSADQLWKAMAGVSAQGKKRGRSRNLMKKKDLNRGQIIGYGKAKVNWPVLVSKATKRDKDSNVERTNVPEEVEEHLFNTYIEKMKESQSLVQGRRGKVKQHPLERGWTGGKPVGRKFGAPIAANKDLSFDNFDSVLIEFKTLFKMTGNMGRVRRTSILMVTGNGEGAVGYTVTAGKYGSNIKSLRKAVNKSGLRLVYIDRYEDRTVYHDFFTQFGKTRIFVQQQPPGYGIKAHRAIKAICEMCGIKDLYAKCEGSLNIQHVVKAFMLGLLRQKTHQALADEKGLHLIEMRKENDYYPKLVASPSNGKIRTKEEIGHNEILDFEMISFEGRVPSWKPGQSGGAELVNPWSFSPGWGRSIRRRYVVKGHAETRRRMRVEQGPGWGAVSSHLYAKYPECVERDWNRFTAMSKARKEAQGD